MAKRIYTKDEIKFVKTMRDYAILLLENNNEWDIISPYLIEYYCLNVHRAKDVQKFTLLLEKCVNKKLRKNEQKFPT